MNRMLAEMQTADKAAQAVERRQSVPAMQGLSSLDKAAQAAFILQMAGRLPDLTLHTMLAAVLKPRDLCNCRRPCCSGSSPNGDWITSVKEVDEALYEHLESQKQAGKKGNYTLTHALRAEIVRQFFDRRSLQTKADLATRFAISEDSIATHQKKVGAYLTGTIRTAFTKLDEILVERGIVGSLEG